MNDKLTTYNVTQTVGLQLTAKEVGSGSLEVFATPMMAAMMEKAAAYIAQQYIDEDCTTVGTKLDIKHLAASPIGADITATATLIEQDGRRFLFNVEAFDNSGKIGEGEHERFSVKTDRFMDKTKQRINNK